MVAAQESWPLLVVLLVFPPAAAVPFVVATGGLLRWVVLGFCIATGPWLTSLALTLTSGIAPQAMGTLGEEWTAHELRRLEKRGWRVVTGVTLPGRQIDHVAVGPSGVLVVETKWSAESWLGVNTTAYMRRSLKSALEQAKQSRLHIVSKLRGIVNDGDVHAVLVLWSAPGQSLEEHVPEVMEGATVLLGSELRSWLDQVEEVQTGSTDLEAAWAKIEDLAFRGDALDVNHGLIATGGPMSTYFRVLVAPLFAAASAWYVFFATLHLGGTTAAVLETATAVLLGIAATRLMRGQLSRFRVVSLAWTTAAIGICVVDALDVLVHHLVVH